ncbi:MAG: NAD-dependent deacetylase [Gallionellaceae bacterium]|nr:NAD-dependent deacetylase [Gallionellaceae bacterium]
MDTDFTDGVRAASQLIANADSLVITAGAGMGVDSGLPDFRGKDGFWKAYPALGKAKIRFEEIANPHAFQEAPELAWGFYGHRLNLYRKAVPHSGYHHLRAIAGQLGGGAFVYTSNVDGHFAKSGFSLDRIVECHGSIHHLQCLENCAGKIWEAGRFTPEVDDERCLLTSPFPRCPECGEIARPNILMFGDCGWEELRTSLQEARFHEWRRTVSRPVVIEIGAGTAIPTVRLLGASMRVSLIRINPAEPEYGYQSDVYIRSGAAAGMAAIAGELEKLGFMKFEG